MTETELVNEVNIRYPIGTIYKGLLNETRTESFRKANIIRESDNSIYGIDVGLDYVYLENEGVPQWAEIISSPKKSKQSPCVYEAY